SIAKLFNGGVNMSKQETKDRRIRTVEQLKELAKKGLECFILLNGGLRSSKFIDYDPNDNSFYVFNYVDDSEQKLTESQLLDDAYTNIGEAMNKGALIMD
ncbi:hypothetical protein ACFL6U_32695, partial [Planctomycetota bacterium]